jgi:hypothetical protein
VRAENRHWSLEVAGIDIERRREHVARADRSDDSAGNDRANVSPPNSLESAAVHGVVLAIALANKLARIAWAVLARGRGFEATRRIIDVP